MFPSQTLGDSSTVAIARALQETKIICTDEPTSALDRKRQGNTVCYALVQKRHTWYVTHKWVMHALPQMMIFMDEGLIVEHGTPEQLFDHPVHPRTKQFLSQILAH